MPLTAVTRARAFFENTQKGRFLEIAFAPMPLAPDHQTTRRARMTRRPLVSECHDENNLFAPQRSNGPQSILRPNTTESKTLRVELLRTPRPTSANHKRATNSGATKSHCCRTAKSARIGTPLTPWRAQKRQQQRHLHVTSNISDAARCIRAICRSAKLSGCDH